MLLSILLFAANPVVAPAPVEPTRQARDELGSAMGAVLQGDGERAEDVLRAIPTADLSSTDRAFRDCSLKRLSGSDGPAAQSPVPFAHDLLSLYRAYWRAAVRGSDEREGAERELLADVAALLEQPALAGFNEAEALIAARLDEAGLHAQMGQTGVLRDLMVWQYETRTIEHVTLPEGAHTTTVHYLDDFLSRGWSSYLTCDRTGTGGWTTGGGLFVIVPSYKSLTDENFRVNFLAHESQHFSDMERFGELPQWRLEYRAKLVELAYADATRERILRRFLSNQSDNIEDAHSYANRLVLERLSDYLEFSATEELSEVSPDRLRAAATALLIADSELLVSAL